MKTSARIEYYIDSFRDVVAYVCVTRYGIEKREALNGYTIAQCKREVSQRYNVAPCNITSHNITH